MHSKLQVPDDGAPDGHGAHRPVRTAAGGWGAVPAQVRRASDRRPTPRWYRTRSPNPGHCRPPDRPGAGLTRERVRGQLAFLRVVHDHPNGSRAGGPGRRDPRPPVHPLPAVGNRPHDRPQPGCPPQAVRHRPALVRGGGRGQTQSSDPGGSATAEVAPTIPDPTVGSPVGILSIPKINLSMVVVEGTGDAQLQAGPGHYTGTPLPGEAGNAAIAGHRTTYLHPFYNLNELVPGRLDHRHHRAGDLPVPGGRTASGGQPDATCPWWTPPRPRC